MEMKGLSNFESNRFVSGILTLESSLQLIPGAGGMILAHNDMLLHPVTCSPPHLGLPHRALLKDDPRAADAEHVIAAVAFKEDLLQVGDQYWG